MLDKIFCRVNLTDTLQLVRNIFITLGNSPVAIYLRTAWCYVLYVKYAFTGFLHWETNTASFVN